MKQKQFRLLLIDDNADDVWLVKEFLSQSSPGIFEVSSCSLLSNAINRLAKEEYGLILLDLNLPDSQGEATFLDENIKNLDCPIIVLTGLDDEELAIKAVQAGAQDYLVKGEFDGIALTRSINYAIERYQLKKQIYEASTKDALTGLYNRKGFTTLAEQQIKLALRSKSDLLFFFIDIDGLKDINDNFGHRAGDHALVVTADILRNTFRDSDILGRAGGDEFVVLAVETHSEDKDAILQRFETERHHYSTGIEEYDLYFSIGVSTWTHQESKSIDALLSEADAAMYIHKRSKRGKEYEKEAVLEGFLFETGALLSETEALPDACIILLIEDNPDDALLIQTYIRAVDPKYEVHHVERLSEALAYLEGGHITLVMVGLSLPDSYGLDGVESLVLTSPDVPLVVITEQDDHEVALKALQLGAQDYLTKGKFDEVLLGCSIKYSIERQRLNVQNSIYARELQRSEARLNSIFNNVAIGMYRTTPEGEIRFANRALVEMMGFDSFEQLVGRNLEEIGIIDQADRQEFFQRIEENSYVTGFEAKWKKADGTLIFVRESAKAIRDPDGKIIYYEGAAEDISAHVEVQKQLRLQSAALDAAANAILICDRSGDILWVNPAFEDMTGYEMAEVIGKKPSILKSGMHDEEFYRQFWETISSGLVWQGEMINRRKDGSFYTEQQTIAPLLDSINEITHFIAIKEDITSRKVADEITQRHLNEMKILNAVAAIGVEETDEDTLIERVTRIIGENLYSDHFGVMLLGESKQALLIHPSYRGLPEGFSKEIIKLSEGVVGPVAASGKSRIISDTSEVPEFIYSMPGICSGLSIPLVAGERVIGVINSESTQINAFSEEDERLLTTVAGQLATAIERVRQQKAEHEQRIRAEALSDTALALNSSLAFDQILEQVLDNVSRIIPHEASNVLLNESGEARIARHRRLDHQSDTILIDSHKFIIADTKNLNIMLETGEPLNIPDVRKYSGWISIPGGEWVRSHLGMPIQKDKHTFGYLTLEHSTPGFFTDSHAKTLQTLAFQLATAMDNARLYQRQQQQLIFLESLHQIDLAITGSLNLTVTLDVIANQITSQLEVDASSILLLDPFAITLEPVSSSGFSSGDIKSRVLRMGEGLGGMVAKEGNVINHTSLADDTSSEYTRSDIFAQEGFVSYYGIPLIAKGQIKGVLEMYHRYLFEPNYEWENFIATVATQAAIAIDNALMFENLEKSTLELSLAYDTTLEGWAKALELRDRETEGHSRRVVEMTLKLGRAMGIVGLDLVHLRRGALLHDVGKMGVSDEILQKSGPLTIDEWEIMRQHPVYAFKWLNSINYLRPALDIPHYHHERWDGTGYPEGLAGEQIPLSARLFAIVDVWDALLSNRPYREAWSQEKAISYIQLRSGSHFDPQIVKIFIELIEEMDSSKDLEDARFDEYSVDST